MKITLKMKRTPNPKGNPKNEDDLRNKDIFKNLGEDDIFFSKGYRRNLAIGVTSYVRMYVCNKFVKTHIRQLLDHVGR